MKPKRIGNHLNRLFGQWTIELPRQISLELKIQPFKVTVEFISEFRLTGSIIMCPSRNQFSSFTLAFKLTETKFSTSKGQKNSFLWIQGLKKKKSKYKVILYLHFQFKMSYFLYFLLISSFQSLSRAQLCDSMDFSTPGFPVHHQFLEFAQTHVH